MTFDEIKNRRINENFAKDSDMAFDILVDKINKNEIKL